jgi:HEAT repeat protein
MKGEERIAQIRQLTDDAQLSKALKDRSNLNVAEAAKVIGRLQRTSLIPDLLAAFERLFTDPVKTDSKCWGKIAIVKTLIALDYAESPPFVRAAFHIQMEPAYAGPVDGAIQLRANAVLALVSCTDILRPEILRHLVDALADKVHAVRIEAVRALEQMNGEESCLVLRNKAYCGDESSEVLGQVFDSLLRLESGRAVEFVGQFMSAENLEVRDEAALALGGSRLPAAVKVLIEVWDRARRSEFGAVILRALSSSREETALEFLLKLVREGTSRESAAALEALELHKDSPEIAARIEQAQRDRR